MQLEEAAKEVRKSYNSSGHNSLGANNRGQSASATSTNKTNMSAKPPRSSAQAVGRDVRMDGDKMHSMLEHDTREIVERIFSYYCSFGDPMNSSWLKSSKFIKFLRDSGVLKPGVLQNH